MQLTLANHPITDLQFSAPARLDGTVLVEDADVQVNLGEKVLLAGDSGSGKSTLVRAIAGLWPWGEGEIVLKPNAKLFLMPQKPYLPLGTLRRAVAYPLSSDDISDEEMRTALTHAGLEHLLDRLNDEDAWANVLSASAAAASNFSPA